MYSHLHAIDTCELYNDNYQSFRQPLPFTRCFYESILSAAVIDNNIFADPFTVRGDGVHGVPPGHVAGPHENTLHGHPRGVPAPRLGLGHWCYVLLFRWDPAYCVSCTYHCFPRFGDPNVGCYRHKRTT